MAFASPQVVLASGARGTTAGTAGSATSVSDVGNQLCLALNVTAISGTPNLTLSVQWSMDGVTFMTPDPAADAFTAVTAVNALVRVFEMKAPFFRLFWVISGGTPSLTFDVTAYVTP